LQGVLVEGGAAAAADAEILRGLKKCRGDREAVELRAEAVDDVRRTDFSFVEGFQRDEDVA
jgi:hypothetical protein